MFLFWQPCRCVKYVKLVVAGLERKQNFGNGVVSGNDDLGLLARIREQHRLSLKIYGRPRLLQN